MPIIKHIPIYSAPKKFLAYIANEKKTENVYITGLNCSDTARDAYNDFKENFEVYSNKRFLSDPLKKKLPSEKSGKFVCTIISNPLNPEKCRRRKLIGLVWSGRKKFLGKIIWCCVRHILIAVTYIIILRLLPMTLRESTGMRTRKVYGVAEKFPMKLQNLTVFQLLKSQSIDRTTSTVNTNYGERESLGNRICVTRLTGLLRKQMCIALTI